MRLDNKKDVIPAFAEMTDDVREYLWNVVTVGQDQALPFPAKRLQRFAYTGLQAE